MAKIEIKKDECVGCEACVGTCPVSLYAMKGGKAALSGNPDDCVMCMACESSCPVGAIKVTG